MADDWLSMDRNMNDELTPLPPTPPPPCLQLTLPLTAPPEDEAGAAREAAGGTEGVALDVVEGRIHCAVE